MIWHLQEGDPEAPHLASVEGLRAGEPMCAFQSRAEGLSARSTEGRCPSSTGQAERGKEQANPPLLHFWGLGLGC